MDKKAKPGRDEEIDDYLGSPTLYTHHLPKNKDGHLPSWYENVHTSTVSIPGGQSERHPKFDSSKAFDKILEGGPPSRKRRKIEKTFFIRGEDPASSQARAAPAEVPPVPTPAQTPSQVDDPFKFTEENEEDLELRPDTGSGCFQKHIENTNARDTQFGTLSDLSSGGEGPVRLPPSADVQSDNLQEEQQVEKSADENLDEDSEEDIAPTRKNSRIVESDEDVAAPPDKEVEEDLQDSTKSSAPPPEDSPAYHESSPIGGSPTPMDIEEFSENEHVREVEGKRIPLPENQGNMCFATTTVHCLLQLKPFCDVIMANATNYEKWTGEEGERGRELCNLVLEAQKSPQKFLTNIIEQCGMELGRQEDAEEFLQLLLQNTTGEEFETAREVKMTCTECQTVTTQTQIDSILSVELRVNESDNLQSELGRMKNGITNHRCTSRKCSRRNKKGQTTIHQVICCNSFSVL